MGWRESAGNAHGSFARFVLQAVLRFLQLVLALAVIGLYGQYLNNARLAHKYADPNFVYAVVVGGLAALTALVYMVPFLKTTRVFPWEWIIFILWVACFGLFGRMFIPEKPEGDQGIVTMKNAVWVDLANMLLWFISATYSTLLFFMQRRRKTLHTGRATV